MRGTGSRRALSVLPQQRAGKRPTYDGQVLPAPSVDLLKVSTVPVDDPGPLLALLPAHGGLAWTLGGEGLVGWGEAARVALTGPDRFAQAQAWWDRFVAGTDVHDEVGLPGTGLVAFGSFAFDGDAASSVLIVPDVVVGHRDGTWWVTTVGGASPELRVQAAPLPPQQVSFADGARSSTAWMAVVADAVRRIEAGEVDKVVLARDVEALSSTPVDVRWPLQRLAGSYPGCWTFSVDGLLGATPEMLVRLRDGVATSRVLAGTLRRSGDANQDLRQSESLTRSIKDIEEHGYGVRSVADALALHCTAVDVPAAPFVLELPNVMHLASDVTGTVADGATSLELVASLHPSAAVCGTPTAVALGLIRQLEGLTRGRYAGPVGWLDASGDGEWGIALRCGAVDPDDPRRVRLFAGCGIVAGSEPVRELAESTAKLVPMRDALQP
ncbi:MAG: isochorismate synthase [Frankiales bacterium]|nr:isochorismate synthase [Frankiales bacterium]